MNLTDAEIARWSNTTDTFEFLDEENGDNWADPTDKSAVSYYLAYQGGYSSNGRLSNVCIVQYCCSGSNDEESQKP